jgi:NAD(P)-dependent dehydrogenase (short-subunit alcohol dehydrogenase family)
LLRIALLQATVDTMPVDLQGQTALVTGGANGIGLAISKELAACGATVYVLDLEEATAAEVAASIGGHALSANVSDRASLEQAFQQLPPLDIVIANAGTVVVANLEETTQSAWDRTIAVNLTGVFLTVQLAAEKMKPRRCGSIVLMASTNSYDGEPSLTAYNASKAGVLGILHTTANELGPYGIRVNAVNPGLIRTRLTQAAFDDESIIKDYFRHVPLGRGGEPAEVARAVAFLASDEASFITGATLLVDGGQMAGKFGTWTEDNAEFSNGRWKLRE